jgi:hypothetical protein
MLRTIIEIIAGDPFAYGWQIAAAWRDGNRVIEIDAPLSASIPPYSLPVETGDGITTLSERATRTAGIPLFVAAPMAVAAGICLWLWLPNPRLNLLALIGVFCLLLALAFSLRVATRVVSHRRVTITRAEVRIKTRTLCYATDRVTRCEDVCCVMAKLSFYKGAMGGGRFWRGWGWAIVTPEDSVLLCALAALPHESCDFVPGSVARITAGTTLIGTAGSL